MLHPPLNTSQLDQAQAARVVEEFDDAAATGAKSAGDGTQAAGGGGEMTSAPAVGIAAPSELQRPGPQQEKGQLPSLLKQGAEQGAVKVPQSSGSAAAVMVHEGQKTHLFLDAYGRSMLLAKVSTQPLHAACRLTCMHGTQHDAHARACTNCACAAS